MSANPRETDSAPPLGRLETLTLVAVIGVLALALGLAALVMPSSTAKVQKAGYTQSGKFSYSANAPASSVYGADGLVTGQPILKKVVGKVTAAFDYQFKTKVPADVNGTAGMVAVVKLDQGFTRTFTVAPSKSFTGSKLTVSGTLPVKQIARYVREASASFTNVMTSASITLRPRIKARGTVGGHLLKTSYAPTLPFSLNGDTMSVTTDQTTPDAPAAKALKPSKAGSAAYRSQVTNTMSLPFIHPSVPAARGVGFGLAGLCLLLGLWLARPLLRRDRTTGESERIRALYGSQLISVQDLKLMNGPVADVASISALAELAKRYESMIMHVSHDAGDAYLVWDNGMLYRYRPQWQKLLEAAEATGSGKSKPGGEPKLKPLPSGRSAGS